MLDMGLEVTAKTAKKSAFTAGPGFCQFWQYLAGTRRRSENGNTIWKETQQSYCP
jgi:hypothetical protein